MRRYHVTYLGSDTVAEADLGDGREVTAASRKNAIEVWNAEADETVGVLPGELYVVRKVREDGALGLPRKYRTQGREIARVLS